MTVFKTVSHLGWRERARAKTYAKLAAAGRRTCIQAAVHDLLEITLETLTEVLEHRGTSGQDDVLAGSTVKQWQIHKDLRLTL